MKNWCKYFAAAGLAVAVLGMGLVSSPAYADPVKDRQAAMKKISKANKIVVGYSKGSSDLNAAKAAAMEIASIAATLPAMFPQGSGMGNGMTNYAKPAIWSEWDKFQKANGALVTAANNFSNWSQMGDAATLKSAAGAIGKTCGGCHKPYRAPKPKK